MKSNPNSFFQGGKLQIEIKNWEKYNSRKDIKNPSWFRVQHTIFDDFEFFETNANDICAFLYLLTCASKKSSAVFQVVDTHVTTFSRLKYDDFLTSIKKLEQLRVIKIHRNGKRTKANAHVTDEPATIHNITGQDTMCVSDADASTHVVSLHKIAEIWNQHRNPVMPEVKACNGSRLKNCQLRWKENPDEFFWIGIVQRVAKSDFCCGRVSQKDQSRTAWVANFDWLVRSGVVTRVLEGMYDNRNSTQERVHPLLQGNS